jgi:hypothetical protein
VPAPAFLLGQLELGLRLIVVRKTAFDVIEPSLRLGLDRIVAVDIDPPEQRHRGLQVDLAVDFQLVDLARRLRIDQSRILVFGKLRS